MTSLGSKLRTAYGVALAVIGALALTSHVVVVSLEQSLQSDGHVINVAGRQRMLSQRMANLSQQLAREHRQQSAEGVTRIEAELDRVVELWTDSHRNLMSRNPEAGLEGTNPPEIQAAFDDIAAPASVLSAQVEHLKALSETAAGAVAVNALARQVVSIEASTERYLPIMDGIVDLYQADLERRAARLLLLQNGALLVTALVLLALIAFVFEPMVRRTQQQENEVYGLRDALDRHTLFSITDRRGRILEANDLFCKISGYGRDELLGKNHRMLNSGVHPKSFWQGMWQTLAAGETWEQEVCNRAKDGSLYWVRATNFPLRDAAGRIDRYYSLRFDITDVKRKESELERARSFRQGVLDAATGLSIIATDAQGTITSFSEGAERMLGYSAEKMVDRETLASLHLPDEVDARGKALSAEHGVQIQGFDVFVWSARHGGFDRRQWTYVRKDGTRLPVILTVSALRDADGLLTGFVGTAHDITERLDIEAKLDAARARHQAVIDAIPGVVFYKDDQNNVLDCNRAAAKMLGKSREEIRGMPTALLYSQEAADRYFEEDQKALAGRKPLTGELHDFERKDGRKRVMRIDRIPVSSVTGSYDRLVVIATDVTDLVNARKKVQTAETRLRLAMQVSDIGLWDWDIELGQVEFNDVFSAQLGFAAGELTETPDFWHELVHPDERDAFATGLNAHLAGELDGLREEVRLRRKDGSWLWTRAVAQVVARNEAGQPRRLIGVHVDIRALKEAIDNVETTNRELEVVRQRLELAIDGSREAVFDWDLRSDRVFYSKHWFELLKIPESALGDSLWSMIEHVDEADRPRVKEELTRLIDQGGRQFESEFSLIDSEGEPVSVMLRATALCAADGETVRIAGGIADITSLKSAQQEMERLVQTDHLTGLASRIRLSDRLEQALARARRHGKCCGVLFFDFDRFKVVNDSLGHDVGDELLCSIAERLRENVRETDTAARLGGDEFVVLLEDLENPGDARVVAQKLLAICAKPHAIRGHTLVSTASIGVATSAQVTGDQNELLRFADAAMYEAKRRGRSCVVAFDEAMYREQKRRAELEEDLQGVIARDELELAYQPIVDLETGAIVAGEVLLRWHHPGHGMISPADFIPIAEESKHIVPIGAWTIAEACRQLKAWRDSGLVDDLFALSVNVSKVQLLTPNFERDLVTQIDAHELPRNAIKIEVTETTIVDNRSDIGKVLESLRNRYIVVMMDDFGTGHSSLSGLHTLPIDELKIDQSFIRHADSNRELIAITSSIVTLAEQLELRTIGEGVETPSHISLLQATGCTCGQGYYWSKPLPAAGFESLVVENRDAGHNTAKFARGVSVENA